jgi:hypothetical protein
VERMGIQLAPVGWNSNNWSRTHTIYAAVISCPQGF